MTFRGSIMKWSFYLLDFDCSAQVCGEFFQLIKYFIALLSSTIFNGPHFWSKFSLTILAAFSKMTLVWAESRYQRFYNCKLWRIRFNVLFQILFSWKTLVEYKKWERTLTCIYIYVCLFASLDMASGLIYKCVFVCMFGLGFRPYKTLQNTE